MTLPFRTPAALRLSIAILLCVATLLGSSAGADVLSTDRTSRVALRHCDPDDAERLVFLENRIGENAPYARWWWRGWAGVYVVGMGFEGTRAALEDDRGKRANSIASAAKSVIGLGRAMFSYPVAARGLEELDDLPLEDAASCRRRVERVEERLHEAALEADSERFSWIPHAVNFALNAGAAVVVAETYDHDEAYWSGVLGFAVGEIRTWSYPWQADSDWEQYEKKFEAREDAAPRDPEITFGLEPTPNGARIVVHF